MQEGHFVPLDDFANVVCVCSIVCCRMNIYLIALLCVLAEAAGPSRDSSATEVEEYLRSMTKI